MARDGGRMQQLTTPMLDALSATRADEGLAAKLALYGQFVGSWHLDVEFIFFDGTHQQTEGEAHFDWVLQGRAIQDVFLMPARRLRQPDSVPEPWWRYGSTFRWYAPAIDAWHVTFFDPGRSVETHQLARAVGRDIVQIGEEPDGLLRRWRFVDIAEESFTWLGDVSWDKGATWMLELRMDAAREG